MFRRAGSRVIPVVQDLPPRTGRRGRDQGTRPRHPRGHNPPNAPGPEGGPSLRAAGVAGRPPRTHVESMLGGEEKSPVGAASGSGGACIRTAPPYGGLVLAAGLAIEPIVKAELRKSGSLHIRHGIALDTKCRTSSAHAVGSPKPHGAERRSRCAPAVSLAARAPCRSPWSRVRLPPDPGVRA